jgi:hypothetical protein
LLTLARRPRGLLPARHRAHGALSLGAECGISAPPNALSQWTIPERAAAAGVDYSNRRGKRACAGTPAAVLPLVYSGSVLRTALRSTHRA